MNKGRLQFRHFESVFETREKAYKYLEDIVNSAYGEGNRLDESLMAEPIVVVYKDANEKPQAIVCIGIEGEKGEGILTPYHIIDSAKLEEDIQSMSGSTGDIEQELRDEIARAKAAEEALQNELDATQTGAGLESDGSYLPKEDANYIGEVATLKGADEKLDEELARVEKARKDITGQETDVYVPNQSLTDRPIAYIADAESLNDADVKLDKAIQDLSSETIKNVVVDGVSGVVVDNLAVVSISGDSIPIGPYENYEGKAVKPHPIHDDYTVLDAIKQLDLNFLDFTEKQTEALNGLHVVKVTSGLDSNVREAYDLVNKNGLVQENSDRILIYKDSSLEKVYLGHVDDYLPDYSSPEYVSGTGDTALCFIYLTVNGTYQLVPINVESFLEESEFKDGLEVNNHEVKVKIAQTSEPFLTVDENGVKLSGVQDAINTAKADEEARATAAENYISGQVTTLTNTVTDFSAATVSEVTRLDGKIDSEVTRATEAENTLTANLNTLSGNVVTLSSATVNAVSTLTTNLENEINRATAAENSISGVVNSEISRATEAENTLTTNLNTLSGNVITLSSSTVNAVNTLTTNLENEIDRATAAENSISADVTTLSSTTESFSAATVAEIARIDASATRNKVNSTGNTILVTPSTDGTNIDVNIDNKTILSDNGVLGTGLKVVPFAGELESNVREAFVLVDNLGNRINDTVIKIYKSSSLISVELINIDGIDYVRITYIDNEGATKTMDLNIQKLIFEAEFKDGLVVNESGEVRVEIDPNSESFLTVSQFGVKLSGIQDAIDTAVAAETARATAAENAISAATVADLNTLTTNLENEIGRATAAENSISGAVNSEISRATEAENGIQNELDATQAGAGLENNGSYRAIENANYISTATSLRDADAKLDVALKSESERATAAENEISSNVTALSSSTIAFSAETISEITRLDEKIDAENEALQEELDKTQTGAGLNSDGTYKSHDSQSEGMAYIATATSIDNATVLLDKGIQAETGRATLAEQSISGIVNTFSAATEAFSAATVAEIARVDGRIDSSNTSLSELSASTKTFSAATVAEIARLDTKIEGETARATVAENSISANVTTLSSTTESFSAATVAEIARLDAQSERNKVNSTGKTIVVTEATEGTNLEVNIDNKTILSNDGELKTGLKVAPLAPGELESNVREAFRLVDNEGTPVDSTIIKIYKSSSLVSVELINVEGVDYVRITYIDNEGVTQTMDLNIQKLIFEAEFKDGLVVNENGEVRVKIDPTSEAFLTVSPEGVKVSGLQNAIDTAVAAETARATAAENSISGAVDTLSSATEAFSAATVAEIARVDGRIDSSNTSLSELSAATIAFSGATVAEIARLDTKIDDETARATAAENSISANVTTLSSATEAFSAGTVGKFELMESGWNVPGSIKHTLEDTFVKSVVGGSAEDANKSLMRYYNDGDEHKYYVSSNAKDMFYGDKVLSTALSDIETSISNLSGSSETIISAITDTINNFSASTVQEFNRISGAVNTEIERATAAENSISENVNTLSASVVTLSSTTQAIQSELDATQAGAGLNSDGGYIVKETANYISAATSLANADMILDAALKSESDRATTAENEISGAVITLSGVVETITETLSGSTDEIQAELDATQAGAGLNADGSYHPHNTTGDMGNYISNAKSLDEADMMLDSALKTLENSMTGSTEDINELSGQVETLSAATESAISNVQSELNATQTGAGLNEDGTYHKHNTAGDMGNYISTANSLDEADMILDNALKNEETRATNAENAISGVVNTLSAATEESISSLQDELDGANETIQALKTELQTLSGVVETLVEQLESDIYNNIKAMLKGADREVKVTPDDTNKTLTIGFADDAIFGENNG